MHFTFIRHKGSKLRKIHFLFQSFFDMTFNDANETSDTVTLFPEQYFDIYFPFFISSQMSNMQFFAFEFICNESRYEVV